MVARLQKILKPGSLYRILGRFDPDLALPTIGREIWSGTSVGPDVRPRLSNVSRLQIDLKPYDLLVDSSGLPR